MTDENPVNPPVWEIQTTHPEIVEHFKQAMREVTDPELGLDVIQLGLIRDVKLRDEDAQVTMILTTPFCPYGPTMMEAVRKKAEEALKKPTYINLGMDVWDFSMMEEGTSFDWGLY